MSEENVEVVRVAYEAFARDGLDRFLEYFTDDVEYYVLAGGGSLELGPLHGRPHRPRREDCGRPRVLDP
jgi:ketosteroid isomerase-like protein